MDLNKFKEWQEIAEKLHGKEFWSSIFKNSNFNPYGNFQSDFLADGPIFPRVDGYMNAREIIIHIEVPGISKKDVQLSLEGNQLRICGSVANPRPNDTPFVHERYYGSFDRKIPLPEPVNKQDVKVEMADGLLKLCFPRIRVQEPQEFIEF